MKADLYAHALVAMAETGKTPAEAVKTLAEHLKKEGKLSVLKKLPALLAKKDAADSRRTRVVLEVASKEDAEKAKAEAGAGDAVVQVNDSLIGGWRLVSANSLTDNSFKKHLLDFYSHITR